jgi:hypothetical protein
MNRTNFFLRTLGLSVLACAGAAKAQDTFFVDFGGIDNTPQGTITPLSISGLTGMTGAPGNDLTTLESLIVSKLQTMYAGYNINFTTTLPSGTFNRVEIGDSAHFNPSYLGDADEFDFRNKTHNNFVTATKNAILAAPFFPSNVDGYANRLATNAALQVGRSLGVNYSDVVSTYVTGGATAVQANEIMTAHPLVNGVNEYQPKTFGAYSRKKLDIATQGVNVQTEGGAATFITPTAADPVRSGDAGSTMATAAQLSFDANGNDVVLGHLQNDADVFKFTVNGPTLINAEMFSYAMHLGNGIDRISDPVNARLQVLDAGGNVLTFEQYNANTSFDGSGLPSNGSDRMVFKFLLPAAGTFGVNVSTLVDGDTVGDYELLVSVPAPGTVVLLTGGIIVMAAHGRHRRRA